jgi:acyl-coenzyme A synthetase/AMP-(fatty) acid ligase
VFKKRLCIHWNERLVQYQWPMAVIFVDMLPRNAMGKITRRQLRDEILKLVGSEVEGERK